MFATWVLCGAIYAVPTLSEARGIEPRRPFTLPDVNSSQLKLMIFSPNSLKVGDYYKLITHAFVHKDQSHLFNNLLGLFFSSQRVEQQIGPTGLIFTFFGGVIAGCMNFNEKRKYQFKEQLKDKIHSNLGLSKAMLYTLEVSDYLPNVLFSSLTNTTNVSGSSGDNSYGIGSFFNDFTITARDGATFLVDKLSDTAGDYLFDFSGYLGASAGVCAIVGFDFLQSVYDLMYFEEFIWNTHADKIRASKKYKKRITSSGNMQMLYPGITTLDQLKFILKGLKIVTLGSSIVLEFLRVYYPNLLKSNRKRSSEIVRADAVKPVKNPVNDRADNIDHIGHVYGYLFGFGVFIVHKITTAYY